MYPWWQCLLFFCAIACSKTQSEKYLSSDLMNIQTIHESSVSKTLLKLLQSPDVQHHISQMPVWKLQAVSDVLSRYPVSEWYRHLPRSQKGHNKRLFKRAMDPDTFMISFKEAIREAVREILAENKEFSAQSKVADHWSRVNKNTDAEVNFLRSIGLDSNANLSDMVSQPQPSSEYGTSKFAHGLQMLSTVRPLFISKPVGTSVDSEQRLTEKVSFTSQPLLKQLVATLPYGKTQNFYYSNTRNADESKTYTAVTTEPSSSNTVNMRLLTSSEGGHSITQESSNSITEDPFRLESNPVFQKLTPGKILTSNFKTSDRKLGSDQLPITEKLGSGLVNRTATIAADLFSSDRKISSPVSHSIPQNDYTSRPVFISDSPYTQPDLPHSTSDMQRFSVLPTPRETFGTSDSFPLNHFSDAHQITITKEKSIASSKMESTLVTAIITSETPIKSNFPATQISYSHESNSAGTSETGGTEEQPVNTARTMLRLPLSSSNHFSPFDENSVSTEAVSFETGYKMISSVTPLPIMGRDHQVCILKVWNTTTTVQTPLIEQTTYENDMTVYSATIQTSLKPKSETSPTGTLATTDVPSTVALPQFTDSYSTNPKEESSVIPLMLVNVLSPKPTELDSTSAFSSVTDAFPSSPNSTEFPNTSTIALSDYDIFHDAINGNLNSNQMAANETTTRRSTGSPFWFIKSLTSEMPSWKSESPEKINKVSASSGEKTLTMPTHGVMQSMDTARSTKSSKVFSVENFSVTPSLTSSQSHTPYTGRFPGTQTAALSSASASKMFTMWKPQSSFGIPSKSTEESSALQTGANQGFNANLTSKSIFSYSSTPTTPLSQAIPSTIHGRSAVSHFVTSSFINVLFTVSQLGNKTTISPISSNSTSVKTSQMSTPASLVSLSKSSHTAIRTHKTPRRLTAKRQGFNISTTTPKSSVFPSITHVKPTLPQSDTSTSALKPLFTGSVTHTNFTRTSGKALETPALKVWIPESSDVLTIKSTTLSKGLPEIQTTHTMSSSTPAVASVPLTFHLTGVSYSEQLSNRSTDEYKRLEREVTLVVNKIFATRYQQEFVQVEILGFSKGSVVVKSKLLFGHSYSPSSSEIVRTVLSDNTTTKNNFFGWNINVSTVDSRGFTPKNLTPESLSISFVVLHFGFIAISQNYQEKQNYLENLQKEMLLAINKSFPVTNISFSQIRNVYGDLEVGGNLFLASSTFTNVQDLLSTLLPLANGSVDLRSINVAGKRNELKVYPFNFRVTNRQFVVTLLDMASTESQKLSKDLSNAIKLALNDKSLLQVVIREFYSGSVACKGDLIYGFPAPDSGEVLRQFLRARTSGDLLGSSTFKVDFQSVTIGDSTSSPFNEYTDFPGFAVAIIVMCGLSILIFPILVFVCYKTRMLGHRQKATIRQRHDPDRQSHHFEMDNRAFRASIEQP